MEKDTKEKTTSTAHWWQTVPGILTAAAALMTATGGLLLALNQVGCFDRNINKNTEVTHNPVEKNVLPETQSGSSNNLNKDNTDVTNSVTKNKKYPGTLSNIPDAKMGESNFKFIQILLDNYSNGKSSLTFNIRLTNNGSEFIYLDNYLLRLMFNGQILSPDKAPAGGVDPVSSRDFESVFIIPDTLNTVDLQISFLYDDKFTTIIPINLNSKK